MWWDFSAKILLSPTLLLLYDVWCQPTHFLPIWIVFISTSEPAVKTLLLLELQRVSSPKVGATLSVYVWWVNLKNIDVFPTPRSPNKLKFSRQSPAMPEPLTFLFNPIGPRWKLKHRRTASLEPERRIRLSFVYTRTVVLFKAAGFLLWRRVSVSRTVRTPDR